MIKSLPSFKNGKTSFLDHVKSSQKSEGLSTVSTAPEQEKLMIKRRGTSQKNATLPPVDEHTPIIKSKKEKYLEMAEKGMQKRKELAEKAKIKQMEKRGEMQHSSPVKEKAK